MERLVVRISFSAHAFGIMLIGSVLFLSISCERQKAVSSSMGVEEEKNLKNSLHQLEAALEAKAPFILAKLAPPATGDQLAELQKGIGGVTVEPLEIWYQWHNGCTDPRIDLMPLGRFLSIAESLEDRKMIGKIPMVDKKRKSALKILDDGAGDGYFLDVTSATPRVFYHMLEDPYPQDYGTLQEFVEFVTRIHLAGLASRGERGVVDFDQEQYDKLESEYVNGLNSGE